MNATKLYLRDQDKQQLVNLLAKYLPDITAWVYGSRLNGLAHDSSDLDIVLRSKDLKPIAIDKLERFLFALRDSNIPILIDARDWAKLPNSFHNEILKHYQVFKVGNKYSME